MVLCNNLSRIINQCARQYVMLIVQANGDNNHTFTFSLCVVGTCPYSPSMRNNGCSLNRWFAHRNSDQAADHIKNKIDVVKI